jgi:lipopolysaccharide export system permease protein
VYFGSINRMILAELVKVFLMSLVALTGMFLLAGLIQEATQKGLSPGQIAMAIPLIIPNTLPFTIPATTLFATCVVYGRMSADNEVLVLRAAGVNIYHLLWPALALGIGTTAATAALYYDTIPRSQQQLKAQLENDAEDILYGMLKREGGLRQANLDYVLFVRDVQGRDLIDVVIKKRRTDNRIDKQVDKQGQYEMVARAQTAKIRVRRVAEARPESADPQNKANLSASERWRSKRTAGPGGDQKELVVYMDRCYVDSLKGDAAAELHGQEYATPLPSTVFGKPTPDRPSSQTWNELFANLVEARKDYADLIEELKDLQVRPEATFPAAGPSSKDGTIHQLVTGPIRYQRELILKTEVEIQLRPALAVGCLCFVLIGCPVGIWASRSDYLSVFIICFLPTMFLYYPLLLAGLNLAKNGKVPAWSAWAADAVGLIVAFVLIRRLMKR